MQQDEQRQQFLTNEYMLSYLKIIAENVQKQSDALDDKKVNGATSSQVQLLTNIDKTLTEISKRDNTVKLSLTSDLGTLQAFAEVIADGANHKTMEVSLDVLAKGVTKIGQAAEKADKMKDVIGSITELTAKASDFAKELVKPIGYIALSIAGLALSIAMFGGPTVLGGILALTTIIGVFSLASILVNKYSDNFTSGLTDMARGITMITASLALVSLLPSTNVMAGIMIVSSAALILAGASRIAQANEGGMLDLAKGIALLSASLIVMGVATKFISPKEFMVAGVALLGLVGVAALASKIASPKTAKDLGIAMMSISGALIIAALGVKMFEMMNVSGKAVLIAIGVMMGLAAATAFIGSVGQHVKKGAVAMILIVASIALVPMVLELYKSVTGDMLVKPGIVLAALTAAVVLVGKSSKNVLAGAGAMLVMVGSLWAMAHIAQEYENVSWENLGKAGAVLGGLTIAVVALGSVSPVALLGAAALAVMAGSLYVTGKALLMYTGIEWSDLGKAASVIGGLTAATIAMGVASPLLLLGAAAMAAMGGSLWVVSSAMSKLVMPSIDLEEFKEQLGYARDAIIEIGSPWALPKILAGSLAASSIGMGLARVAVGMKLTEGINMRQALSASTGIMKWAKYTIKEVGSLGIKEMLKANVGIAAMSRLGTTLTSLALGVSAIASSTFNEYAVDSDGNVKVVAVHKLTPADFAGVGDSIARIVTSITKPLADFGAGGGLFTSSDTEKGMESLSKIGKITGPIIDVAKNVEVLDKADFTPFSRAVDSLVKDLAKPLKEVSSTGTWFTSNDFEKGFEMMSGLNKLTNPIIKLAKNGEALEKFDPSLFNKALQGLIWGNKSKGIRGLQVLMKSVAETGTWFTNNDYKKGFESLQGLDKLVKPISAISGMTTEQLNVMPFLNAFNKLAVGLKKPMKDISGFDNKIIQNMKVVSETAKALGQIADADLTNLARHNYESQKSLFEKIDEVIHAVRNIRVNVDANQKVEEVKKAKPYGEPEVPEITIETISLQIGEIANLLKVRR